MSKKITFVEGDDWRGIYVDGTLVHQGHDYPVDVLADIIGGKVAEADLDWLDSRGNLPAQLVDVETI